MLKLSIAILGILTTLCGCSLQKMSNHINSQVMSCGDDVKPGIGEWLVASNLLSLVGSEQLAQIKVQQIEANLLSPQALLVSKKACVLMPALGVQDKSYLIVQAQGLKANLPNPWLPTSTLEFVKDEPQYFVTINSPKRQFNSLDTIPLAQSAELHLKSCFKKLDDPTSRCLDGRGQALWDDPVFQDTFGSVDRLPSESGDYRLYILGQDVFERVSTFTFDLEINNKLPKVVPDFVSAHRSLQFQQRESFMVEVDYKLGFVANKPLNQLSVNYCLMSLLDAKDLQPKDCDGSIVETFDPFAPKTFVPGFWLLLFQVKDLAGNVSAWESRNLVVGNSCEANDLTLTPAPFCTHIRGSLINSVLLKKLDLNSLRHIVDVDGRLEFTGVLSGDDGDTSLENLRSVGSLVVFGNYLYDLRLFKNLQFIRDSLEVSQEYSLKSLTGLENLHSIPKNVVIQSNLILETLQGLNGVQSIGGTLRLTDNPLLNDLSALRGLKTLVELEVRANKSMTHIGPWPLIEQIQTMTLQDLPNFSSLEGLPQLTRLVDLKLQNLGALTHLKGLESLREVKMAMLIQGNPALTSLKELAKMEYFFSLSIIQNKSLTELFEPALGESSWPSLIKLTINGNDRLCGNVDQFFPLPPDNIVRDVANNCI